MKKFTLLVAAVLITVVSFGQKSFVHQKEVNQRVINKDNPVNQARDVGTIIMEEDFEGGALPTGWTTEIGAATQGWTFNSDASSGYWPVPAHTIYAAVNDDACDCDMSNMKLITPAIDLSSATDPAVGFDAIPSNEYGGFHTVEVSIDGGTSWTVVDSLPGAEVWTSFEIMLTDYIGEASVQIAFKYNDDGAWATGFAVDDVQVYEYVAPAEPNIGVTAMLDGLYPVQPMNQTPSFNFMASIMNTGAEITDAFDVNLSCVEEATYTDAVAATVPMATDATEDIMFPTAFEPTAVGMYTVVADAAPTGDVTPENNSDTTYVIASDTIMARELGTVVDGALGFGAGTAGWFGQGFEITNANTEMTSVTFTVVTGLTPVRVDVYDDDAGAPGAIVGTTGDYTIQASDTTETYTTMTLPLESAVSLSAGSKYYLIMYEADPVDNIGLAYTNNFFAAGEAVLSFDGST
ncbi:MAG TPA: choice-of-anchor J domain-containing protein, partial [Bacteroidales bacterium]|nr:choice-of-anchor J domain-containing protein [Bacteroidales bacterium]